MMKTSPIYLFTVIVATIFMFNLPVRGDEAEKRQEKENQILLKELTLPVDASRSPTEKYYERNVIRMSDGQPFVVAYWRNGGSPLEEAIDIFAIDKTSGHFKARRVYSDVVGGQVSKYLWFDIDGDHKDELIILHETGGQILSKGVTILRYTPAGFSKVFRYQGHDIWIYHEHGQIRIMVKETGIGKIEEFAWDKIKGQMVIRRTLDLVK